MNAHRAVDRAPNPLSPVRIPETPTAKTPLTQDPFYYLLGKAQGKSLRGRTQSRWGAVVSRPVSRAIQRPSGREPITNPNRTPSGWGELQGNRSLRSLPGNPNRTVLPAGGGSRGRTRLWRWIPVKQGKYREILRFRAPPGESSPRFPRVSAVVGSNSL
jgi:hypothetical protein